jgi:hypothetical protein
MDEQTAQKLATIVGGDSWQSGGGIYLVTVRRDDGSMVVFSDEAICEYESEEAFEEADARAFISIAICQQT